ncbi:hypothetical protein VTK26DRAFT_4552 [Humicola hyalothermophila]
MQAVPSLVGTGTAVAAAAAGLVFGQPPEPEVPWSSPTQQIFPPDYDGFRAQQATNRPSTSAATPHQTYPSTADDFPYASFRQLVDATPVSPLTSSHPPPTPSAPRPLTAGQASSPKVTGRRHSFMRLGDIASRPIAENARDSVSSRESWIRRLSLRPLSQHGSPRSSVGPETSSMTFSHGSGVPMLGQPPPLHAAPNKLVKRATSGQDGPAAGRPRRGSRSQVLTLRRPATSHQRSATLQQFRASCASPEPLTPNAKFSFDNYNLTPLSPTCVDASRSSGKWTSFFHARRSGSSGRDISGTQGVTSPYHGFFPRRRMSLAPGHVSRPYLTKPDEIADVPPLADEVETKHAQFTLEKKRGSSHSGSDPSTSTGCAPDDRLPKRSLSTHFSSAGHWIAKTGSVRRPRRSTVDGRSGGGRYAPHPLAVPPELADGLAKPGLEESHTLSSAHQQDPRQPGPELESAGLPRTRKRNYSSPLPPLNRLSSFNLDVAQIELATSTSAISPRPYHTPINYPQQPQGSVSVAHSRGPSGERSVTLAGSDFEARDGVSGEDEDTDGMYDSFRTGTSSNRVRSVETPLESMFDESPPSTASNSRTKRLSIQEMLGRPWDGETKITEEDENLPTPIRAAHLSEAAEFEPRHFKAHDFALDLPEHLPVTRDFERLSFDDDDDDDWARDDENTLSNHLSPPSSTNSRRVSPTFRQALRNASGNASPDRQRESMDSRPRSNIFDWSEPSVHDKHDPDLARPKTVHGKQELDLRGGRPIIRKPPGAAHVRSQSVPVVHDAADGFKPQPKFGTWGLGTKTASEDWDDDFEFDGDEAAASLTGGKDSASSFMVVPASIQATQPSVRAHSGQIRELSLLVNDLKRLCRHGKELDILQGPAAAKWAEAESIIALASPDEDEPEELGSTKPSMDLDRSKIDDRFLEEGFDGPLLDHMDDLFGFPEPEMSKTAVVRERHSVRRRSVFSPDDDIFGGNWPLADGSLTPARSHTPDRCSTRSRNSAISIVIEAMQQQQQRSTTGRAAKNPPTMTSATRNPETKLFFDTNSLQGLVKRAGHLRDALSDAVRRAELLTQSPAGTPRRESRHATPGRHGANSNPDGSPAFTRVFEDPGSSPPPPSRSSRLPTSRSTSSILSRTSGASASVEGRGGLGSGAVSGLQMMTVS